MTEQDDSPLGRVRQRLYAPAQVDGVKESILSERFLHEAEKWKETPPPPAPKKRLPGSVVFLGFALGFFVIAGGVAATVLFLGGRSVSSDRLQIRIEGPTTISGGESVPLLITIRNENPTVATGATLEVAFPEGTFAGEDASTPLTFFTEELGDIPAGTTVRKTVHAAFFGEENQRILIPVKVEYRTGQSNAVFVANKSYELVITTAPVTLSVTTLSEVTSGQPLELIVLARSNAAATLENIAVHADYPFGFLATSETPQREGELFVLGTLSPGEEKEVRVRGTLSGQEGEERVFKFAVGSLKSAEGKEFGASYSTKDALVLLAKPFLATGLTLNRSDDSTIIVKAGELISGLVSWENTLKTAVLDGRIEVRLSGDALDTGSVDATNGFFRSLDKTILFEPDTTPGLRRLEPGDSGNGNFIFTTKTGTAMNALRNPSIQLSVSVSGRRVGEGSVGEKVESTVTKTVKIETDLSVSARSVRTEGPFENSGPWPPIADSETTYTILLSSKNTVNTVAGATVKMTLPSYVRFTGLIEPAGQIKYNETTREIMWSIGDMAPGAGRSAAFQVALLPSTSQQGTSPLLTSDIVISGHDRFIEQETRGETPGVSTETKTDSQYQDAYGQVE